MNLTTVKSNDHLIRAIRAKLVWGLLSRWGILLWGVLVFCISVAYCDDEVDQPSDVIVAVIDTGVDSSDSHLSYVHGWDFIAQGPLIGDHHGHGTHIAGIISSVVKKAWVAYAKNNIKIMPLRYYSENHSGSDNLNHSVQAIYYAIEHGAKIINYSGGGAGFSMAEFQAIQKAEEHGILFIAAAGNNHNNIDERAHFYYPSSYTMYGLTNIITVAAINQKNHLLSSSNWGIKTTDVAAPGERILSTLPKRQLGYMTGTSQATAIVSGVAAVMLSINPLLTPRQIRAALISTVDPISYLRGKIKSGGKVNLQRALLSVRGILRNPAHQVQGQPAAPSLVAVEPRTYFEELGYFKVFVDQLRKVNGALLVD